MKKWKQKAIVQKIISFLPWGHRINFLFQKFITKGVYLSDTYFIDRLIHAGDHLAGYRKFGPTSVPQTSLEIGTGWYPVVPVALFLAGADRIYSVDIALLTSRQKIKTTLQKFSQYHATGQLAEYLNYKPDRYQELQNILSQLDHLQLNEILKKLRITYIIENAAKLSIPDDSIDLVTSNNTFEHIYPQLLIPILKEFKRIVKKQGGVMSHFIDMSDHFAHFDTSINIYNFLQYSDAQWRWIDNSIQPQNRLRFKNYLDIYNELEIPVTEHFYREGNPDAIKSLSIDSRFARLPADQLAISHCHLYSKMG